LDLIEEVSGGLQLLDGFLQSFGLVTVGQGLGQAIEPGLILRLKGTQ
jgi:hypothetical protein